MKKILSIILSILMVVTMLPMAVMPASAAYDYDETAKISFEITNLVREWKGETEDLGEYGSGFYEQSLTKVADGKYKYTYRAALSAGGGTWWSDPKTVTFDGVDCESDYYKTFDFTESTSVGGYTMTWTYTLEVKRYKGHTYSAWSDNGDGTHTRTCQVNSTHVETLSHNWVAATCVKAKYCMTCGFIDGEPVADAHKWMAATCIVPKTCSLCQTTDGESVADAHNWGTWGANNNGTHSRTCKYDSKHIETVDCSYSEATCTALMKCSVCKHTTGDYAKDNHSSNKIKYEQENAEEHKKYHTCCESFVGNEPHDYNAVSGICRDCMYQCKHPSYTYGKCDSCGFVCTHNVMDNICTLCGKEGVVYLSRYWDDESDTVIEKFEIAPNTTEVTSETTSMKEGWYVVRGNVTVPSRIEISGTVHLILADGADFTAAKGIKLTTDNTLYVYSQSISDGMGKLTATADEQCAGIGGGYYGSAGKLIINGGTVVVRGGKSGSGIGGGSRGAGGNIIILGGYVSATGGANGAGIGSGYAGDKWSAKSAGSVTIYGGTVEAIAGARAAGIGGGQYGNGANVIIKGGNVRTTRGSSSENIGKGNRGVSSGTLQDGNGNNVYLNTITLSGAEDNTTVTEITGVTYGVDGVATLQINKLYFYLPSGAAATSITAGGVEYICNRNLTYYTSHGELVDATCLKGQHCAECGCVLGEAVDHNFTNGVCTVCGSGKADGIIYISTAEQLMMFADYVNYVNKDADAVLMADIDLAEYTWTTICETGLYYSAYGEDLGYSGTFDGNGYIIKNINVTSSTTMDASCGLFGTVSGTIKNLGVEGFTFVDGGYDIRTGAIVGQLITANGKVENCYVKNATITPGAHVTGGIAGCVYDGTIENCYVVSSNINGTANRYGYIVGDSRGDKGTTDRPGSVTNCYTDNAIIRSNNVGNVTNCETKSTEAFASGEVAYLLNGSTSEGDLAWGQLIGTDSYPVFGGETVYYNESNGYYNILHTCDFSGEWKYDADKHWKECTVDGCDKISEDADHSFTDGKCDCGYICTHESYTNGVCDSCEYECPHEWGEGVLTRPVYDAVLGSKDGYYTYTCTVCGDEKKEAVKGADYSAYEAVSEEINGLLQSDDLTPEAKQAIYSAANECGLLSNDLMESEQNIVDDLVAELEKIITDAEEKIANGEYVKADYTAIDEAIEALDEKFADENVTDEGKAGLDEIKTQLEAMKADENTSAADLAELEKALEEYEAELDKGIADGTLVEIDIWKIADEANKKWKERFEAEGLTDEYEDFINNQKATDEALAVEKALGDFADSLEGTVAENAENIAKFNEMFDSLFASLENCLRGTHNFEDYEITSPAKCEVNAIETGACWFCGETDEREVEGTALTHSFTKYEETEAPKCGVAGKEAAYCDNGCQTIDEREIPALQHSFLDYASNGDATCTSDGTKTAECANGCGATDTVADEGTILDHTDEDGDKICDDCGGEAYERCGICGGKAHGDDKIQILFCFIITIIRVVTSILKSIN